MAIDFSTSFIEFVKKLLCNNGIRKPASHIVNVLTSNFLDELAAISNPNKSDLEEKPFPKFVRIKFGKVKRPFLQFF